MLIDLAQEREKRIRARQPDHCRQWHEVEVTACLNLLHDFTDDQPERLQAFTGPSAKMPRESLCVPLRHYVLSDEPLLVYPTNVGVSLCKTVETTGGQKLAPSEGP